MKRGYLWGAGYYADFIYSVIDKENCIIVGLNGNSPDKTGHRTFAPYPCQKVFPMQIWGRGV